MGGWPDPRYLPTESPFNFPSEQGPPGIDGKDGTPGIPGLKVGVGTSGWLGRVRAPPTSGPESYHTDPRGLGAWDPQVCP